MPTKPPNTREESRKRKEALERGTPFRDPDTGKVTVKESKKSKVTIPSKKKALDDEYLEEAEKKYKRK